MVKESIFLLSNVRVRVRVVPETGGTAAEAFDTHGGQTEVEVAS